MCNAYLQGWKGSAIYQFYNSKCQKPYRWNFKKNYWNMAYLNSLGFESLVGTQRIVEEASWKKASSQVYWSSHLSLIWKHNSVTFLFNLLKLELKQNLITCRQVRGNSKNVTMKKSKSKFGFQGESRILPNPIFWQKCST